ncbi:MAG: dTDP-4-dehydrorhamnose 3,5-epimerase family protein [Gammaproteobacteria bacterium]|nr:dTDP-4-dehydrorhamnose 3,5-epimerase family protein [Gammaproteobacteria bacterium]
MIEGVSITPLRQIQNENGKVMHMIRVDSPLFTQFGEIYFSCTYPKKIKAWKRHKEMRLNCVVLQGKIKFVLYDDRENSQSKGCIQEIVMCPENYFLLTVPPLIWTGFTCMGDDMAILANCASIPHRTEEVEVRSFDDPAIPYSWSNIK